MNFSGNTHYPIIEKENIANIHLPKGEVLSSSSAIQARILALSEACRLGNEFQGKVRIIFMTEEGIREVHTTIWNVSDEAVSLKGGVFIPMHAIIFVEHN